MRRPWVAAQATNSNDIKYLHCRCLTAFWEGPTPAEFEMIVGRMSTNANLEVSADVPKLIASFSNGSLEKASTIVKRVQDFFGVAGSPTLESAATLNTKNAKKPVTLKAAKEVLEWMGYKNVTSI